VLAFFGTFQKSRKPVAYLGDVEFSLKLATSLGILEFSLISGSDRLASWKLRDLTSWQTTSKRVMGRSSFQFAMAVDVQI
jgi:hypothetical protein